MATPIASFGNNSAIGSSINEKLLPEYEIVHASLDLETALKELPAIASGNLADAPASGLGTNAKVDAGARKAPKAIIIGGTVPADEAEKVKAAISAAAPGVVFVQVTRDDIVAAGGSGPDVELIVKIFKQKLGAAL